MEPEKIVQQFNNVEWDSNGDPLYSYDQMLNAVKQALQQTHVSGALPPSLIYIDKLIPVAKTELKTIVDLIGHDAIVLTRLVSKVEEYLAAMTV